MIIDAKDLILGRLASYVAKKALLGEEINIINCEKAVITGSRKNILAKYLQRVKRGGPEKGPFFPRMPHMIVKRTIRNMLPYKKERGRKALKKIKCYINVPEEFKDKNLETIKQFNVSKTRSLKYIPVKEISKALGKDVS